MDWKEIGTLVVDEINKTAREYKDYEYFLEFYREPVYLLPQKEIKDCDFERVVVGDIDAWGYVKPPAFVIETYIDSDNRATQYFVFVLGV